MAQWLSIQCCHCCGLGCCYGEGSNPVLGTSAWPWVWPKKKKSQKYIKAGNNKQIKNTLPCFAPPYL